MARSSTILTLDVGRGAPRARRRAAVLSLTGVQPAELRRGLRLARGWDAAPWVIGVDGGLAALRAARVKADGVVGDADSVRRVPPGLERVDYPADKDFSDLSGALRETRSRGVRVVVLAGLAGGRLDHEWINLHEAGAHAHAFDGLVAPTPRGMLVVTAEGCRLDPRPGRPVSLLVLGGSATVSLVGTRWTLRQARLRPGSRGLSNVTGERLRLQVHAGAAALVFP